VFRSIYLKTLRDYRIAIAGWGIGMGLVMVELFAAVGSLINTPQARAELAALASQFAWNAAAVRPDTPGGYAMFKIGVGTFLICVWPLLAASRALRGEEEGSRLDILLSAPRARVRVALEKVAAIWTALALMGLIIAFMTYAAAAKFNGGISLGDALLFAINISLICAVFGAVALLVSQFTRERATAAGITGALLVVFIMVDMVHRVIPGTEWISRLSPIYYYNLSKALVPSYGASVGGMLVELAVSVVLTGAAVWLFVRRDVGDVVPLPGWLRRAQRQSATSRELPVGDWSLGSVYLRGLGMIAMPTLWWTVGLAALGAWLVVLVEQMANQLQKLVGGSPVFERLISNLGGGGTAFNDLLLSTMFFFMPLLLMAFAVTQVNRWASDEDDGRLELVLATPQSRSTVMLGRYAALATSTVLIGLVALAAVLVSAVAAGLSLNYPNITAATLGIIPMGLLVAAIGYFAGGWVRTAVDTGLLSFLLAAWFFISFIGPELKLPDATLRLSAFYYYGTPVLHGLDAANMAVLVGVAVVALVLAVLRFARKDLLT
jgi:polyether ionophore transport system permease protein